MGDNTEMGTIPRFLEIDGRTNRLRPNVGGRVGIVAGLGGRYRGLGNGLGFGWLGSIGLFQRRGDRGRQNSRP
jgi:hypothetical protein